ncbi:MAG: tetratricopeptide repeat protein [Deltaproteobacteria bacterium]|nr:tetratricopeptide repeat protein [Deltaproteobacteria bacterium]
MRAWCVTLVLLAAPVGAAAQQPEQASHDSSSSLTGIFEAANIAGSRGDYSAAISNYSKLSEAGVHDPDVYFNLATSFAQSGDYPRAILNYERALSLRPRDGKASENLRDAERALEEQRAENEGEATIQRSRSISNAVYGAVSEEALAVALLIANLLFFLAIGWTSVPSDSAPRRACFVMGHAQWHSTITSSSAKDPTPGLRCGEKRGGAIGEKSSTAIGIS